ncbi:6-phosphofructokinase [Candidatus Bathyarchaeota archaeon]|nr:6-phosphofructokinase [Candidatus Bathyarchaeota archaeon]
MKKLGIVTSGGDAPGMNATIRAVVRTAIPQGFKVLSIKRGYAGLVNNEIQYLDLRLVGNIIHLGGTFLGTERCKEFTTDEGLRIAAKNLEENEINTLIVIGGDGSFRGALDLSKVCDIPIIGIPATIDNDVAGTDTTIGFDTAVNTALSAIDKIRDTAMSHGRIFVVEVMGKKRGFLALEVGLTSGAEKIIVPEEKKDLSMVCDRLKESHNKGKRYSIIVIAEGVGKTQEVVDVIRTTCGYDVRLTRLGYIQRGGSPTARSRLLANLFGSEAINMVLNGEMNKMVGIENGKIVSKSLKYVCEMEKPLNLKLLRLAEELAI